VGTAVDPRNGHQANLTIVGTVEPVDRISCPRGMLTETKRQWDAYWADPVHTVQTPVDRALLLRWIKNLDRYERLITEADKEPLVANSQGQSANPLYAVAHRIESSVKADEAQLGIGPLNRSKLGIAVITERRSLADMNGRYAKPEGVAHDPEEDPRRAITDR
jgi:P27 family predicted phage terminase small subunit